METELQKRLSGIAGAEVTRDAAMMLQNKFAEFNTDIDEDNLVAPFDCGIFDVWCSVHKRFENGLTKSLGGDVSPEGSDGEHCRSSDEIDDDSFSDHTEQDWENDALIARGS